MRRAHERALAAAQAKSRRGTAGASTTAPGGVGSRTGGTDGSRSARASTLRLLAASGDGGHAANDALADLAILYSGYTGVHHAQMRRLRVTSAWSDPGHGK